MFFLIFSFDFFFIQTIDDDDHGQGKKRFIDQGKYMLDVEQQQQRRTISAMNLFPMRSDNETQDDHPLIDQNPPRRARSMLNETKCAPS